ncbi:glycerophosphodiester phosphodiesterase [Streptomyces sp. NPDC058045]|uniref:glycerophosphodiester phosphodiesterase n=1 Tax=Streptomyces sp. NPDC058045 TaxID=3346311 RepID=UPI0036E30345
MHPRAATALTAVLVAACTLVLPASSARAVRTPVVVAHRGASAEAPENTLPALDRAHELGIDWVETDVQRTRDGRLVVIHDTDLRRTTDAEQRYPQRAPWRVGDFTAAEIAGLDAGSWKAPGFAGTRVPTLAQWLRRVAAHHQNLLLEFKAPELYPGIERQILDELGREGWLSPGRVAHRLVVQSFNADSMRTVHGLRPDLRTAFLGAPSEDRLPGYAAFCDQINPSRTALSADYVRAVHGQRGPHGRRLQLFVWTVDDAAAARKATGDGVDGIISNRPDVVRGALGGYGAPGPAGSAAPAVAAR